MIPDERSNLRQRLYDQASDLGLQLQLRRLDEFWDLDDSLLVASSGTKDGIVLVCEDVTWGPEISTYIEPIDEFRERPVLFIHVPNSLEHRIGEVMELLRRWFVG